MSYIEVKDVSFSYTDDERLVLKDISLNVEKGEFVCLLGQSGCGKSTFLRLLAGLEWPAKGVINVDGKLITKAGLDRGVVFQDYGLFPWMTAGENIVLALTQKFPNKDKRQLKETAVKMLQAVGLDESIMKKYPKALSGGMKQRCAIARAFGIDPPVLLMDEPFGALDAVTRAKLQDLLLNLWSRDKEKKTVFFVTHDVDEAILLANRICVLGQSPSNIIYECRIPEEQRPARDTQFEDVNVLKLRNELIRNINRDVKSRI
ncbi:ABC transporter ATP-binding protein [Lachnospiraceae bacterium 42-17]|jgi:NitT/TauT family transport system ATP-binding protein|nr:ABC transporter ATP-binding protein [Dorea sp.]